MLYMQSNQCMERCDQCIAYTRGAFAHVTFIEIAQRQIMIREIFLCVLVCGLVSIHNMMPSDRVIEKHMIEFGYR